MIRRPLIAVALALAVIPAASAKSDLPPGNYVVYYSPAVADEKPMLLIKIEHKGGKDIAEILEGPDKDAEVKLEKFEVDGRKVLVAFDRFGRSLSFAGTISEKDPKVIIGIFGDDRLITRGRLVPTDKDKLAEVVPPQGSPLPEPFKKAEQLRDKVGELRTKLRQAEDDETKADLKKQIEEARQEVAEKTPALYREVLDKHPDSQAVVDAAAQALPKAERSGVKAAEVGQWLKAVDTVAEPYGARYRLEILARCLDALARQKGYEAVALEFADKAEKGIVESTTLGQQARVLKTVHAAQLKAGKDDSAKQTQARIATIDEQLDKEYLLKVPPFKPAKFAGRKGTSDRVAVMELFTGAQCPPCIAADVAFDALQKSYKPSDLILIQYHMHIPGPDPMTNADSEARWKYYGELRGTPSSLFNGKVLPGGGGGMAQAQAKFDEYKIAINPLLEQIAPVKIIGSVTARDDMLAIKVDVSDVKDPGDNLKLRLVLVEETIKYAGGNGLRFHHQVVRAFPGGVDGTAIKDKSFSKTVEVNLADLRKSLTGYLDDYSKANDSVFSDRPLALKHLRIIALVQDDSSKEILQAIQLEVPGSR
jgi:hypothetical protein